MAQLFSPRSDIVLRVTFVAFVVVMAGAPLAVLGFARTPGATGQYRAFAQPVPFDHPLHVRGLLIDCRFCHSGVETAAMAGLPPTQVCVPCHIDALMQTPLFAAVRTSLRTGRPIAWKRVHSVPDFVFFNHAVHVRNGVDCATCHGPVESMRQVYQAAPLTMEWCVECHRAPERYIAVRDTTVRGWKRGDLARGRALATHYDIARLTSCTTCHR